MLISGISVILSIPLTLITLDCIVVATTLIERRQENIWKSKNDSFTFSYWCRYTYGIDSVDISLGNSNIINKFVTD